MTDGRHPADEELLLSLEAELPEPRLGQLRAHCAECELCRLRLAAFQRAEAEWAEFSPPPPPASPAAATRLRDALRPASPVPPSRAAWWSSPPAAAALLLLLASSVWFWWRGAAVATAPLPLPVARLTPGAVRSIPVGELCRLPLEDEGKLVPAALAARVFQEYGITRPEPRAFEVDYLISPALGGATAAENLWPLPYADGVWTSRVKDALEDRLRSLVCAGQLDLATAQRELATNWIAAYQKYFHSRQPIEAHARFVKDSPWE